MPDLRKRRWSFSLRMLFVAVTIAACLLYLMVGKPIYVTAPLALLFSAAFCVTLLVGIAYGGNGWRAFCIGAVVPAAGYFFGTMSELTSAMNKAGPVFGVAPSVRELFEGFGSGTHFRTWFAMTLGVSLVMGLMASIFVRFLSKAKPPAIQTLDVGNRG